MTLSERPYQLFFPLALFGAFALSLPWVPVLPIIQKTWSVFPAFPRTLHIEAALQLFLTPAVTGFLLTAWPRIHGAAAVPASVVAGIFAVEATGGLLLILGAAPVLLPASLLCLFAAGLYFFARGTARPVFSICILTGIAGGLTGSIWRLVDPGGSGTAMIVYGMMPLLIGGAGGMLVIPMSDYPAKPEWKARLEATPRWLVWVLSVLFLAAAAGGPYGAWVQAALSILCAWRFLHLNELQYFKSTQSRLFAFGAGAIMTGFICMALFPYYRVHLAHILLAAGLSSAIAAVMVQVILSHGGHVMRPLPGSKALAAAGLLLLLAAATRVSAALIPGMYLSHLSYAALTFGAAWTVWVVTFAGKIRHKP